MSGDVFGNGMLLSRHIRLVAAFNHLHVFLDPDPDPERSFEERKRLFELPRSSWGDYDESLISEGGGVFARTAKSIKLSQQIREVLDLEEEMLSPNELIQAMLRAPVDLLWNGGIGTYVKASSEANGEAGDKANDPVRIDGDELRCKVVGEGGNLGFTQRARIEYALAGGKINTDAIDNVAGVNTSDHEVNIKILLGALVADGDMTFKQRNVLLTEMTDAVGDQVLYGSYTQTQAMSLALVQAAPMVDVHARLIHNLEQVSGLDRGLEFLPSDEEISDRKAAHQGLVSPELAVVMAYCKIHLYAQLLSRPAGGPVPGPRPRALLPAAAARALQPRDALAPAEPGDHRDRRRQSARRSRGHHVLLPARRGDRRAPVDTRARVRGRA